MSEITEAQKALQAIGDRWRHDWSEFDGRTLRDQINSWIKEVNEGTTNWDSWLIDWDICAKCHTSTNGWDGCKCE